MLRIRRTGRRGGRLRTGLLAGVAVAVATVACDGNRTVTQPNLPGNPGSNPQIRSAAFLMDVNTRTGEVKITAPTAGSVDGLNLSDGLNFSEASPDFPRPSFSILAGDVVELTASGFAASALGEFTPGKVRVTFDVNITNRLASVQLVTPTFPVPPAGTDGVVLFPYETVVTTTSGGVSVGGDGTDVIVELPNEGEVGSSIDWTGEPFNFFNDTGCGPESNDCYRHEVFAQPLAPGATSEVRTVGFDIDPTVGNFRARLIVAADLQNAGAAPTGTVSGTVSSPQRGALSGVVVTVNTGGFTGTTDGAGAYAISGVTTGPKTVTLSSLPSGCSDPGSQSVTVTSGGSHTVTFSVTCDIPSGSISGTVTSSFDGAPLSGVQVSATPTGGSPVGPSATNPSGQYVLSGVPVGSSGDGVLTLANLPSNCTDPGAQAYSGLTDGGTLTVNLVVSCAAPPAGYQFTNTWGPVSGGQVTLTIAIDMSTFDDPAIPGDDDIFSIQVSTTYDATQLAFVSTANVTGSGLQNQTSNGSNAGLVNWLNFTTSPPATGAHGLIQITFNVIGSGIVTTGTTIAEAFSQNETNLGPNILVTEGTIDLP